MKRYMIAYVSPKYGVLMTELEVEGIITELLVQEALLAENETPEDVENIIKYGDWQVKEIKPEPLDKHEVNRIIFEWVKRTYGSSEAYNPSWSIVALANEIVKKLNKGE